MRAYQNRAAAALLAALLAAVPAASLAGETAPLTLVQEEGETLRREDAGKIEPFGHSRAYLGVSASDQWLYQARIGGSLLNLRLFTPKGEGVCFEEKLGKASTGGKDIRLCMRQNNTQGGMMLQLDQAAVDVLTRLNITQIVVTDYDYYIQSAYQVEDLAAMRSALKLAADEQLCVSGEDDPVSIVSADGVRRLAQL